MSKLPRILVTGATGLVGNALVPLLLERGWSVRANARNPGSAAWAKHPNCEFIGHDITVGPGSLLDGMQAVVHLAARVHIMRDTARDPLAENRRINTTATLMLAEAAAARGVGHFVYVSSIKVNGEATSSNPFTEADPPAPQGPYALSKHEAEQGLAAVAERCSMGVTVLRPPLVYGQGVTGNLAGLMRAIARRLPLPLGAVKNRRSLIYAGNLAEAILATLCKPAVGFRTYLVSDGEDLSTPDLIRVMATAMERPAILLPVPPALLRLIGMLTGRTAAVDRLLGSLVIDSSLIRNELGWNPSYSVKTAMTISQSASRRS